MDGTSTNDTRLVPVEREMDALAVKSIGTAPLNIDTPLPLDYELAELRSTIWSEPVAEPRPQNNAEAMLERLRETFFSAVNHEMRTPLALIYQMIEVLEDPRFGPVTEVHLDALTAVRRQADNLGQMIDGLTHLATLMSKQSTFRPIMARIEPLVRDVLSISEFKGRSKQVSIQYNIEPNLPPIYVDVEQFKELITQLVDNGIKFNDPGGTVKVSIKAEIEELVIEIADNGVGINPEILEQIWVVFEQDADPFTRAQEGLGVGLAIVGHIVDLHGGSASVDSVPGKGSCFTVRLPLAT